MEVFGGWWGEDEEFVGDDLKSGGRLRHVCDEDMVLFLQKSICFDRREREKLSRYDDTP